VPAISDYPGLIPAVAHQEGLLLGDRASAGRMPIVGEDGSVHPEPVRRTGFAFADGSN